jgi:hypothetical protein
VADPLLGAWRWNLVSYLSDDTEFVSMMLGNARSDAAAKPMASDDQLWHELERRLSAGRGSIQRLLFVGFAAKELGSLLDACRRLDPDLEVSSDHLAVLRASDRGPWDCMVINHDAFEDPQTAVDDYLALRKRFPDRIVILISSEVGGDDLGLDRAAICDATLQFPVSLERLRLGLRAAAENRRMMLLKGQGAWR